MDAQSRRTLPASKGRSLSPTRRVLKQARDVGVRMVRIVYADNGGVVRAKSVHIDALEECLIDGIRLPVAMQAVTMLDEIPLATGMGAMGEFCLMPDPETFRILPYVPRTGAMIADMTTLDGLPWDLCPRAFLKRQIAGCASAGFTVQVAFEVEFYLARLQASSAYVPTDECLCYSTTAMTIVAAVIDDMIAALESQGLHVEHYNPELGHGQQELTIRPAPALTAADHQVLYRETVRTVAFNHGLYASLAPKPFLQDAGSGAHIHFSLWNATNESLLYDSSDTYHLSRLGYHFIAGVIDHLPGLLALTCPSYNSYRRLQPRMWSSAFATWGPDNRECALRLPSPSRSHPERSINIEFKPSDSSTNPYLALGGMLAAGLDGVRRVLMPPAPTLVDPSDYSDQERNALGIRSFPATLSEALTCLEHDPVLMGALGPSLAAVYLAVKRCECEVFLSQDENFEIKHHFWKF